MLSPEAEFESAQRRRTFPRRQERPEIVAERQRRTARERTKAKADIERLRQQQQRDPREQERAEERRRQSRERQRTPRRGVIAQPTPAEVTPKALLKPGERFVPPLTLPRPPRRRPGEQRLPLVGATLAAAPALLRTPHPGVIAVGGLLVLASVLLEAQQARQNTGVPLTRRQVKDLVTPRTRPPEVVPPRDAEPPPRMLYTPLDKPKGITYVYRAVKVAETKRDLAELIPPAIQTANPEWWDAVVRGEARTIGQLLRDIEAKSGAKVAEKLGKGITQAQERARALATARTSYIATASPGETATAQGTLADAVEKTERQVIQGLPGGADKAKAVPTTTAQIRAATRARAVAKPGARARVAAGAPPGAAPGTRPGVPAKAVPTTAARTRAATRARAVPAPPIPRGFTLPGKRKLPPGVFPRIVEWQQGVTIITLDLDRGTHSFRPTPLATKRRTPARTLKIIKVDRTKPRTRVLELGVVDVVVSPDSLRFRQRRGGGLRSSLFRQRRRP